MQTKLSPNMLPAQIPAPAHQPEMLRLEEVLDFPAAEVHLVVTKAAFNAPLLIRIQLVAGSIPRSEPEGEK